VRPRAASFIRLGYRPCPAAVAGGWAVDALPRADGNNEERFMPQDDLNLNDPLQGPNDVDSQV